MAPSNLLITTPRPTVAPNTFTHTGRGGFGNTYRVSSASSSVTAKNASTTVDATAASTSRTRRFFSGVGGAGNIHSADERPAHSLVDDEIARARARERSGVSRRGIGGAGNVFRRQGPTGDSLTSRPAGEVTSEQKRRGSQWSLASSVDNLLKPLKS